MVQPAMKQRTYWHLGDLGRVPSAYSVASSKLRFQFGTRVCGSDALPRL